MPKRILEPAQEAEQMSRRICNECDESSPYPILVILPGAFQDMAFCDASCIGEYFKDWVTP